MASKEGIVLVQKYPGIIDFVLPISSVRSTRKLFIDIMKNNGNKFRDYKKALDLI